MHYQVQNTQMAKIFWNYAVLNKEDKTDKSDSHPVSIYQLTKAKIYERFMQSQMYTLLNSIFWNYQYCFRKDFYSQNYLTTMI